jgi:riboflavin kinase/FMN adenylyltransferase
VVYGSQQFPGDAPSPVVTIGNFDGVHLGHRALIAGARALAGPVGAPVCVYTFDPAPRDVMVPGHGVPAIQSLDERLERLGEAGADWVVVERFSRAYAGHTAEFFALEILKTRLRAAGVVVGWDFRFGKGRKGDHNTLRELLDVPVHQVEALQHRGEIVSSTRVRQVVQAGDVAHAAELLTQPHEVSGIVVHGDGRGRTIGVPTANVVLDSALRPAAGVYAVRLKAAGGAWWSGVANLGVRPTVGEGVAPLEVHLLDRSEDLYGQSVKVGFITRLRGEQRFDGLDALVTQIRRDIVRARQELSG